MQIILLHSAQVEASRGLLSALGVAIPEGDDVTVQAGANTVRVISKHALAVSICPNFSAYPFAVATGSDGKQYARALTSWDAIWAWAANPIPQVPATPATLGPVMSKATFLTRMITPTEGASMEKAVLADTTGNLAFVKSVVYNADDINLTWPPFLTMLNSFQAVGVFTADRVAQILDGKPLA